MIRKLALPEVQLGVAGVIILGSLLALASALCRFVPFLEKLAIGRNEPFWVLLLSILALLFSGLSALPSALAYKEANKLTPD